MAAALLLAASPIVGNDFIRGSDFVLLQPVGCNATSLAQVPDSTELFVGRQLLTADGQVAGITGPNDCSGGNPDNEKTGNAFNRWALTLSKFDWSDHKFALLKLLVDTSLDGGRHRDRDPNNTPHRRARIDQWAIASRHGQTPG
jgi:hypothetical protein